MAVGSLSGCQKAATSENLFRDIEVNMTSVESAEENQIVKLQMGDGDSAISQESNLDIEMTRDPGVVHRKGQQKTSMAGMKEIQEMESYQVEEDGKTVIYSGTDEAWEKNTVEEKDTSSQQMLLFGGLQNLSGAFTVSQDLATVNKEECFELTGTISGTQFRETFADTLEALLGEDSSDLSGWNLQVSEEEDGNTELQQKLNDVKVDCVIDVYRSNILPAKISFDLTDYLKAAGEENAQVTSYTLEVTFVSYNDTKKIKVPKAVKESAKDNGEDEAENNADEMVEEEDQEAAAEAEAEAAKGIQSDLEGAAPESEELGASWNSYTVQINGKVLTLPCTIADLESTGLKMDEKSLPSDYEIEAGDYQNAWFKDDSKNTVMVDLINTGNDVKEAKDCLVGGIYVEKYSLRNEDLTVTFPGGIQLGTAIDVVQAAYGEASQHTESELVNVYNWYEDGSFYNSCEIDTSSTDGTVSMMGISRFEVKNGE